MRREYQIIKPSYWKRNYEIQTEEGLKIGEVNWKSAYSYKAGFKGRGREWSVKLHGAWNNHIKVMDWRGVEIGEVERKIWTNKITFYYKGREYRFRQYHWAAQIYLWEDVEGRKLMSFKGSYWGKNKVATMRTYGEMDAEFMDLMTNLGWYLVTFVQIQQAGAAT